MLRLSHALVAVLAIALPSAASAASPQSFKGEYTVSFLGLSIARSTFSSHYENGAYAIDGTVTSAGLAKLFDDTRGTISSKGTFPASRWCRRRSVPTIPPARRRRSSISALPTAP